MLALIVILTLFPTHNLNKEYHTALIKMLRFLYTGLN